MQKILFMLAFTLTILLFPFSYNHNLYHILRAVSLVLAAATAFLHCPSVTLSMSVNSVWEKKKKKKLYLQYLIITKFLSFPSLPFFGFIGPVDLKEELVHP